MTENKEKNNYCELNGRPLRLLIGGSPCTFWSISQSPERRETTCEGTGWELFKNYLIAKEKWQPDIFLYENNESISKEILVSWFVTKTIQYSRQKENITM